MKIRFSTLFLLVAAGAVFVDRRMRQAVVVPAVRGLARATVRLGAANPLAKLKREWRDAVEEAKNELEAAQKARRQPSTVAMQKQETAITAPAEEPVSEELWAAG